MNAQIVNGLAGYGVLSILFTLGWLYKQFQSKLSSSKEAKIANRDAIKAQEEHLNSLVESLRTEVDELKQKMLPALPPPSN